MFKDIKENMNMIKEDGRHDKELNETLRNEKYNAHK